MKSRREAEKGEEETSGALDESSSWSGSGAGCRRRRLRSRHDSLERGASSSLKWEGLSSSTVPESDGGEAGGGGRMESGAGGLQRWKGSDKDSRVAEGLDESNQRSRSVPYSLRGRGRAVVVVVEAANVIQTTTATAIDITVTPLLQLLHIFIVLLLIAAAKRGPLHVY